MTPSNAWFIGAQVHCPNDISIGSGFFAQLMLMCAVHALRCREQHSRTSDYWQIAFMHLQVASVNCTATDVGTQQKGLCNTNWHLILRSRSRCISSTVFMYFNNGWYIESIKSPQSSGK